MIYPEDIFSQLRPHPILGCPRPIMDDAIPAQTETTINIRPITMLFHKAPICDETAMNGEIISQIPNMPLIQLTHATDSREANSISEKAVTRAPIMKIPLEKPTPKRKAEIISHIPTTRLIQAAVDILSDLSIIYLHPLSMNKYAANVVHRHME